MSTKLDPNSPICLFTVDIMNNWAMEFFQIWHFSISLISFFSLIYVYGKYRQKLLLFHINASILFCVMCSFTAIHDICLAIIAGLNFEMFLLNGRDCDGLLFEPGACFPLRIVFDFGIYGQTISLLGIAIERYCAISMTNRYKFVSSTLGLVLTTFVIVFTMALVLYVHFHEDPTELQFNCGPVTRTAASAANIVNLILIFIDLLSLIIYFIAFWRSRSYVSFKSTQAYRDMPIEERYQYSETNSVITLLFPLVLANVFIFVSEMIILRIIDYYQQKTGITLFLFVVEFYLPPYYALVLPPFIVFMLRRIELQRKVTTQRMLRNQGLYSEMSIEAITSSWQVEKNPPSVIQEKLKSTSPNDHHNRVTPFQA